MSLLPEAVPGEAFAEASRFRAELYECLALWGDERFELVYAVSCAPGAVHSAVELTLLPEHRRGHGAMYDGRNQGRIDTGPLRSLLAGLPLPRFPDGRLVRDLMELWSELGEGWRAMFADYTEDERALLYRHMGRTVNPCGSRSPACAARNDGRSHRALGQQTPAERLHKLHAA